jgi:hypothetical protein
MGWFTDMLVSVGTAIVSVGAAVVRGAARALHVIADLVEDTIEAAKDVWKRIGPFVRSHIHPFLARLHDYFTGSPAWQALIRGAHRILEWALVLEESWLGQAIDRLVKWLISAARKLAQSVLSTEEVQEGRIIIEEVKIERIALEHRPEVERVVFGARVLQLFSEVKTAADRGEVEDSERYVQLRIVGQLCDAIREKVTTATSPEQLDVDDLFLAEAASELLHSSPKLSIADLERLESIVMRRCGRSIKEVALDWTICRWTQVEQHRTDAAKAVNKHASWAKASLQRYVTLRGRGDATAEDERTMQAEVRDMKEAFKKHMPDVALTRDDLAALSDPVSCVHRAYAIVDEYVARTNELSLCANAAEGLVQFIQHPEKFEQKEYLTEEMPRVQEIIVDVGERGQSLASLPEDKRQLLWDFGKLFEEQRLARMTPVIV